MRQFRWPSCVLCGLVFVLDPGDFCDDCWDIWLGKKKKKGKGK